jgi:hypothetical protein
LQLLESLDVTLRTTLQLIIEAVSDVVIAPGRQFAIVKVINSHMTAHKGRWSWDCTGEQYQKVIHKGAWRVPKKIITRMIYVLILEE